jgi:hypothetical protein
MHIQEHSDVWVTVHPKKAAINRELTVNMQCPSDELVHMIATRVQPQPQHFWGLSTQWD